MAEISVIIPVYNAAKYLENTLNCVLKQTFNDFEVILVDDGSTDGSGKICDFYVEKDKRIKVVHQKNQGVSVARNTGIDCSNGNYICFIDADDEIDNKMLEILLKNALDNNADISCCGIVQKKLNGFISDEFCTGEKAKIIDNVFLMRKFFNDPIYREVLYGPCNKIIKSKIVKEVMFNKNFAIGEDLLFNFECIEKCNVFYFENIGLYNYIRRENSATTSSFSVKRFDYIYVADILLNKCKNIDDTLYKDALYWTYIHKLNMCRALNKYPKLKKAHYKFYEECWNFCKKNISSVQNSLTLKKKLDFILLNVFSIIYRIV